VTTFHEFEHAGWSDPTTAVHYDNLFSAITMQSVAALLQAARLESDRGLLDVATGPGYVAGAALAIGANVIAIDFSPEAIALARVHHPSATFYEGDAQQLAFDDATFDAVTCNYGVPHFSEAEKFFAEAFRVLRPGGRLAFSVWDVPARCRVFGAIYEAIAQYGTMNVGLPAGPNFFLFSEPQNSIEALQAAGFVDTTTVHHAQNWSAASADDLFEAVYRGSVRAAGTLRGQTSAAFAAIRNAVGIELEQFRRGDQVHVPMPAVIASGRKPV
jgi:ubiquinone/menaquinone biosynthesis C-methylase UbiE